jgi:RNA polymerase sigma-70 factor (ECF subfamily)
MISIETLQSAKAGDENGLRSIYETRCAWLTRLAFLLLGDIRDAEEVVQDTFVYVFQNIGRFDPSRSPFDTWLRVVLVSRCRNKRRKRAWSLVPLSMADRGVGVVAGHGCMDDPERIVEMKGELGEVIRALERVSVGARDALVLRYFAQLPYGEIAEALGCSADAARARVAHAKVQLRRLLVDREHCRGLVARLARDSGGGW